MLKLINLVDNSEKMLSIEDFQALKFDGTTWVEAISPSASEVTILAEKLGLSPHIIAPSELSIVSPLHLIDDRVILTVSTFEKSLQPKLVDHIILAFSKSFLVTVSKEEFSPLTRSKQRLHKDKADNPIYVVNTLLDEIVSEYYVYLEKVEDETAELEENILERPSEEVLKSLFRLKSQLISFNKMLWYQRGAMFALKKAEFPYFTSKIRASFDDVHDDLARQIDIVETFREVLSDALDAYLSSVSNRINLSIKGLTAVVLYLTVVTVILTFPNTVATIFGIPAFSSSTDWRIISTLLVASAIIPLVWLYRQRWLRFE